MKKEVQSDKAWKYFAGAQVRMEISHGHTLPQAGELTGGVVAGNVLLLSLYDGWLAT